MDTVIGPIRDCVPIAKNPRIRVMLVPSALSIRDPPKYTLSSNVLIRPESDEDGSLVSYSMSWPLNESTQACWDHLEYWRVKVNGNPILHEPRQISVYQEGDGLRMLVLRDWQPVTPSPTPVTKPTTPASVQAGKAAAVRAVRTQIISSQTQP